jgi:hypothetical protein
MSTEQDRFRWSQGSGMRTPALILMVAVAATSTLSCADSPLDVMDGEALVEAQLQAEAKLQAEANHTWRAGASPTWHGYHAPDVTAMLGETSVALCAAWGDDFLFARDNGRYADTDFFSFDLSWQTGGSSWSSASVRNAPGSQEGCVEVDAAEGDLVEFTVKGMAKFGTGRLTSTHHTVAKHDHVVVSAGSGTTDDLDDGGPATPADPLEGATVLYFTDYVNGTDQILPGLQALAAENVIELTVADSRSDLIARLDDNPDVVVHFNQDDELQNAAWTPLVEWVEAGNRLILADWQMNTTILGALEATGGNGSNGGGLVFSDDRLTDGVQQPMLLSDDLWYNYALPLAPLGDGVSVCAFDNGNGSSCMVLGNDGRTAAIGFLADVVQHSDAHALIRNLLRVLMSN